MQRRLKLATGLVIAVFVIGHLLNLALGLLSLEAMERMRGGFVALWHSPPMTVLLYGSFAVHIGLGLVALYRRSHLRMSAWEAAQLLFGLAIPVLLLAHAPPARLPAELYGATVTYDAVIAALIRHDGWARQGLLLLLVWAHLVIGVHFWLRLRPWYPRLLPVASPLAILLPLLALLGFARASLDVQARAAADPGWLERVMAARSAAPAADVATIQAVGSGLTWGFLALVAAVLVARLVRRAWRNRHGRFQVEHTGSNRTVTAPVGQTLLEAIRGAGLPHASVCGGRGRCTTCRVRVGRGDDMLPPPDTLEMKALHRIEAPPQVRLACQVRPRRDLVVTPLVDPAAGGNAARRPGGIGGREQRIACLFCDLRGSTALGETRLPYDVVFILNRFFAEMAEALAETDGHYAQFTGDGLMALYGLDGRIETGCRDAVRGAVRMLQRLEGINRSLADELDTPLRMGIGIHAGEAIVGTMGPPASPIVSAVGDTINIAARLESQTKDLAVPLVVSCDAAALSGLDFAGCRTETTAVRGRRDSIGVLAVDRPAEIGGVPPLPPLAPATGGAAARHAAAAP